MENLFPGAETPPPPPPTPPPAAQPRKFLFVSLESLSGDLAWSLVKEGHEVRAYIKAKQDADVYDGFIQKVDAWEPHKDWADVILFDDVEFGPVAEKLRKAGKLVIGGSVYTDRLEMDREFGQAELKRHGINILPSWQFDSIDDAINLIEENPNRYVFKPSGNVPSAGKGLLFISEEEDGKDLKELLLKNKAALSEHVKSFLLQRYVNGVEVAVGAYFNGREFIYPICVNFEHKRIFAGNIGPFGGEMGTLMYWSEPNDMWRATLDKMVPAFRESGYVGYLDLNCIVTGKGIYPLEFTCRFGYPTIQIQQEGILTPTGEWLYRMARGESFALKTKRGLQIGVRVLVPSYFDDDAGAHTYKGLAIMFRNPQKLEGVHIEDVRNDDGVWRIAGTSGVLLVVTASGTTIEEARRTVYNRVKNLIIPNMFYRTDIGAEWPSDSDKLWAWGYVR